MSTACRPHCVCRSLLLLFQVNWDEPLCGVWDNTSWSRRHLISANTIRKDWKCDCGVSGHVAAVAWQPQVPPSSPDLHKLTPPWLQLSCRSLPGLTLPYYCTFPLPRLCHRKFAAWRWVGLALRSPSHNVLKSNQPDSFLADNQIMSFLFWLLAAVVAKVADQPVVLPFFPFFQGIGAKYQLAV